MPENDPMEFQRAFAKGLTGIFFSQSLQNKPILYDRSIGILVHSKATI